MAKHPNQYHITVRSSSGKKKNDLEKPYGIITEREFITATHILGQDRDGTALALFVALATNQDGYPFDFSPQAYENRYGISVKRWSRARQTLERYGYLVNTGNNNLTFYSLPPQYRNVSFLSGAHVPTDGESVSSQSPVDGGITERQSPVDGGITEQQSPVDGSIIPRSWGDDPPLTDVSSPVDGGSNNKTIQYNKNNTGPDCLNEKIIPVLENDLCDLESERDMLLDSIRESFGEWEDTGSDIMSAYSKSTMHGRKGRAALAAYIDELKKVFKRLTERRSFNMNKTKREYRAAINATMPGDTVEYMKVKLILDKFEQGYKAAHNGRGWPWTWGVWVNGWNEELQEPNFTVSMFALPPSVIANQRHNLEGIPKEYFKTLGKKE